MKKVGIIAAQVIGGIAGYFLVQILFFDGPSWDRAKSPPSDAEIERHFAQMPDNAGDMYFAIKEFFPEEAAFWRDEARRMFEEHRGGRKPTDQEMFDIGAQIRKRHAPALKNVSGPTLVNVLDQQLGIVEVFEDDAQLCNAVLMKGPIALPRNERSRIVPKMAEARVLYRAMHEGRTKPVSRAAPTEEDWARLRDLYLAKGFTDSDLALVAAPDPNDPRLCGATLGFFRVLRDAQFPGADALKAEVAAAAVGS